MNENKRKFSLLDNIICYSIMFGIFGVGGFCLGNHFWNIPFKGHFLEKICGLFFSSISLLTSVLFIYFLYRDIKDKTLFDVGETEDEIKLEKKDNNLKKETPIKKDVNFLDYLKSSPKGIFYIAMIVLIIVAYFVLMMNLPEEINKRLIKASIVFSDNLYKFTIKYGLILGAIPIFLGGISIMFGANPKVWKKYFLTGILLLIVVIIIQHLNAISSLFLDNSNGTQLFDVNFIKKYCIWIAGFGLIGTIGGVNMFFNKSSKKIEKIIAWPVALSGVLIIFYTIQCYLSK